MKRIKCEADLEIWYKSPAFKSLETFLTNIFSSVKGLKLSEIPAEPTEIDEIIWKLLDKVSEACEEVYEHEHGAGDNRYGNKSFRILMEKIEEIARKELKNEFLIKLFKNSFGDSTRIDYGTGHELSFLIFITCYTSPQIQKINKMDYARLGCWLIGCKYLNLVRRIQGKYLLEPAGSHGVWGLDDYQFVPFLIGSSQLIGHVNEPVEMFEDNSLCTNTIVDLSPASMISPKTFSNKQLQSEYLYPAALNHIHQLKTRCNPSLQFHNHSPLLYDISGVQGWEKIHAGLRRMYEKEVLGKVPVVQHILFDEELFKYEQ